MSRCSGVVQSGKCKCSFVVTHFSTFAVGDAVVTDNAIATPVPSSSIPIAPNIAAIAGGVVGGILLIAIVAYLIMKARNKAGTPVTSESAVQIPKITESQQAGVAAGLPEQVALGPPRYASNPEPPQKQLQQQ